jgi:hypothetical protein
MIIYPNFNNELDGKIKTIISKHTKLIFSNFSCTDKYNHIYIKKKSIYSNEIKIYKENRYNHNNQISYSKSMFNKQIDNNLPSSIKYIKLGHSFNQTVDNLGTTLEEIIFGYDFNQRVDYLPFSIKSITFGYLFNQPIDNIPNSIIYLSLSYSFNNKLDDLPIGLETLVIGESFSNDINCLPKTLKFLEIKSKYYDDYYYIKNHLNICSLPKNLEVITIVNKYKQIEKYNIDNIKYKFEKEKLLLY